MHRLLAALCAAVVPLVATATIYKVRMPDGSILFTDSVPPGGKVVEQREAVPTPSMPMRPAPPPPRGPASRPDASPSPSAAEAPANLDAAMAEVSDAERSLAEARRRLEAGREPLPGERLGTATGGSRLTPEYENRIAGLERDVAAAEERVRRAYAARNALR